MARSDRKEEIEIVLNALRITARRHPDLRIGQLIDNAPTNKGDTQC